MYAILVTEQSFLSCNLPINNAKFGEHATFLLGRWSAKRTHFHWSAFLSRMYFSAIVILTAFVEYFSYAGPIIAKQKWPPVLALQANPCQPGEWACSTGKRSGINKATWDTRAYGSKPLYFSEEACPPGIWTCLAGKQSKPIIAKLNDACPPGVWTCSGKKRSDITETSWDTDTQRDTSKLSYTSENACPPGIWTCSVGKESDITKVGQVNAVISKDETDSGHPGNCLSGSLVCKKRRILKNAVDKGKQPQARYKRACPPGMWTCSTNSAGKWSGLHLMKLNRKWR